MIALNKSIWCIKWFCHIKLVLTDIWYDGCVKISWITGLKEWPQRLMHTNPEFHHFIIWIKSIQFIIWTKFITFHYKRLAIIKVSLFNIFSLFVIWTKFIASLYKSLVIIKGELFNIYKSWISSVRYMDKMYCIFTMRLRS